MRKKVLKVSIGVCFIVLFFTQILVFAQSNLDYWIEKKEDGDSALVWLKIPEIPANSLLVINLYYGNSSLISESDINKVMIFGDDYEDGILDNQGFLTSGVGNTQFIENNGKLMVDMGYENSDAGILVTNDKLPTDLKFVIHNEFRTVGGFGIIPYVSEFHAIAIFSKDSQPTAGPPGSVGLQFISLMNRPTDGNIYSYMSALLPSGYKYAFYDEKDNQWYSKWENHEFFFNMGTKWAKYELISNGTHWWTNLYDPITGGLLATSEDSPYAWSDTTQETEDLWMLWGLWYDWAYYGDMESEVTYVRKWADIEPLIDIGVEEVSNILGFTHMKKVFINNTNGDDAATDYQVKFDIPWCQNMQNDFSDIRFFEKNPLIEVMIDIKPSSYPNSINPKNKGVIPVAVLTTDDFDAQVVDGRTVRFGPNEAEPAHYVLEALALIKTDPFVLV